LSRAKSDDFDTAFAHADRIKDPSKHAATLAAIAVKLTRAGRGDEARTTFARAIECAIEIPSEDRDSALLSILREQARAGDRASAFEAAARIEEGNGADTALVGLAIGRRAGDYWL
jgi:hypothetical protein